MQTPFLPCFLQVRMATDAAYDQEEDMEVPGQTLNKVDALHNWLMKFDFEVQHHPIWLQCLS